MAVYVRRKQTVEWLSYKQDRNDLIYIYNGKSHVINYQQTPS